MTFARNLMTDTAMGVGIADTPEGLSVIHAPGCAAAIWHRQPLAGFQSWIDGVEPDRLPRIRTMLPRDAVRDATRQICEICGTPGCPECDRLIDDTAALAEIFADLMHADLLRLRFDVITKNSCDTFRTDGSRARLICTYRGPGTQYGFVTEGDMPKRVHTVPTCAPMVLRGELWPETPKSGLRHRAPPIGEGEDTRLVLVLETAEDGPRAQEPKVFKYH